MILMGFAAGEKAFSEVLSVAVWTTCGQAGAPDRSQLAARPSIDHVGDVIRDQIDELLI